MGRIPCVDRGLFTKDRGIFDVNNNFGKGILKNDYYQQKKLNCAGIRLGIDDRII